MCVYLIPMMTYESLKHFVLKFSASGKKTEVYQGLDNLFDVMLRHDGVLRFEPEFPYPDYVPYLPCCAILLRRLQVWKNSTSGQQRDAHSPSSLCLFPLSSIFIKLVHKGTKR